MERNCSKTCWSSCLMQRRSAECERLGAFGLWIKTENNQACSTSSFSVFPTDQEAADVQRRPRQADTSRLLYAPPDPGAAVSLFQWPLWRMSSFCEWEMWIHSLGSQSKKKGFSLFKALYHCLYEPGWWHTPAIILCQAHRMTLSMRSHSLSHVLQLWGSDWGHGPPWRVWPFLCCNEPRHRCCPCCH